MFQNILDQNQQLFIVIKYSLFNARKKQEHNNGYLI